MFFFISLFLAPLAYLVAAASLAALTAYPLYFLLDGGIAFHKLVSKGTLLLMILGIYPVLRCQGLNFEVLGFSSGKRLMAQLLKGFGYGLLIMTVNLALLFLLEVRVADLAGDDSFSVWVKTLGNSLLIGFLVAFLEELLFRGVLLGEMKRHCGSLCAVAVSAFYYAGIHFLRGETDIPLSGPEWYSGFKVIGDAFSNLFFAEHLDSFLALLALGIFLGCVRIHVKTSLGYCIGMHASWVFLIKITKRYSDLNPFSPWSGLVGGYDHIIGYPTALLLMLLSGAFAVLFLGPLPAAFAPKRR